jgi:hypothetical protein
LLSRALPDLRRPWPRQLLALYLSFLLVYGLGNAVQDFELEQIVKRGLTSYELPMVLTPALSWAWAVLLAVAAGVYGLAFRPLTRLNADRPHAPTPREPRSADPSWLSRTELVWGRMIATAGISPW